MKLTHRDERCPADATVARQVSEEEIRTHMDLARERPGAPMEDAVR
jgi:hypothetical protein